MTIEELKALSNAAQSGEIHESIMFGEACSRLSGEILALMEAANNVGWTEPSSMARLTLLWSIHAFNAKLETL
jgi:hypothetical protein